MQKNKNIFLALLAIVLLAAACVDEYKMGEFDANSSLMPGARTDGPVAPSAMMASFDDYCDKVELSWLPTVRTTAYDVYRNGELIAQDLTDTSYVDMDAQTTETEYTVYSKNANGNSETAVSAIGRMSATPLVPENFTASDGEFEVKVDLSWDAADFAKHYIVKRGDMVLSNNVSGTSFSDSEDAPQEDTEYSVIAVGVCGESDPATAIGKADSLLKYSVVLNENFEGLTMGELTSGQFADFKPRFKYEDAPNPNGKVWGKDDNSKYLYLDLVPEGKSIQLLFPAFELLVGKNYRITFDIKTSHNVSLHMGIDKNEDGFVTKGVDDYFMPTTVNAKNGNAAGLNLAGTGEWKSYSFDFPQTGTATGATDPDPSALGWTLGTIQAGQENPIFQIQCWNGKAAMNIAIDNVKIELIK